MSTLKERKEDFVSGLNGGTIPEIYLVTSVALVSYFCWNLLSLDDDVNLFIDYALNWACLLLSITTYSNDIALLYILMIVPVILVFLITRKRFKSTNAKNWNKATNNRQLGKYKLVKRSFITAYRGGMLILTSLAILAVDFRVFPRRFAKVETWGTSLMDLGVGSFVFSNGLVSSRVILKYKLNPELKPSLVKRSIDALRSGGTLLLIGLLRLFFVKNLEYQEHVTEYGIHWNFFITLAFLPPFLVFLDPITERIPRVLLALIISFIYEAVLIYYKDALNFLILAPRNNFFSSNREGIVSFLGYCAIFLIGQNTGYYCLGNMATKNNLYKASVEPIVLKDKKAKLRPWDRVTSVSSTTGLLIWTLLLIGVGQVVFSIHPYDVSRRFANLPYVLWVCACNLGILLSYSIVDEIFTAFNKGYHVPLTLEAINSNGLVMFLLANVGTGFINMSISTIDASEKYAISILLVYALSLAVISITLYNKRIFIRL